MASAPFFRKTEREETLHLDSIGRGVWITTPRGYKTFGKTLCLGSLSIPPLLLCNLFDGESSRADWPTVILIASLVPAVLFPLYSSFSTYNSSERRFENCSKLTFALSITAVACAALSIFCFATIGSDPTTTTT